MAINHVARIGTTLCTLGTRLGDAAEKVATMTGSEVDAGRAQSLEDLGMGLRTALVNLLPIAMACMQGKRRNALSLAEGLENHIEKAITRPVILNDLHGVIGEAEQEQSGKVGKHRNPAKQFIDYGRALPAEISASKPPPPTPWPQ